MSRPFWRDIEGFNGADFGIESSSTTNATGVYVHRRTNGFEVKELKDGTSGRFTYRVVAKRKGFETNRLEASGDPRKFTDVKVAK
jgi:hypothetical protein